MNIKEVNEGEPERRSIGLPLNTRKGDSRRVEGYALLFDTPSDGLGFEEVIERGALEGVIDSSDVFVWLNHDSSRGLLARRNEDTDTLELSVDGKGLYYAFDAPNSPIGDELLENLRRGEIKRSSLAFTVSQDTWEKKDNGEWKRTIHKIKRMYDVSPVYDAAYSKTSVNMRGRERVEMKGTYSIEAYERMLSRIYSR